MALHRLSAIPYDLELRDIDSCLYRLDQVEGATSQCCDLDTKLERDDSEPDAIAEKLNAQTRIFDHLEAFLAAWARLSLLLFPTKGTQFAAVSNREDR